MLLNELLEKNSITVISKMTNISENNLEALFSKKFEQLKRVKTLGFISIIEREYKIDLSSLQQESLLYYDEHNINESVTLGLPLDEEKPSKSKWLIFIILVIFVYASWYIATQFDKSHLQELVSFQKQNESEVILPSDVGIEMISTEEIIQDKNKSYKIKEKSE